MMVIIKVFFMLHLLGASLMASEVDQFTGRGQPLKDALPIINAKTNQLLQNSLQKANRGNWRGQRRCSERKLYHALRRNFKNHISGKLNPWILKSAKVPKRKIKMRASIYQDFSLLDSLVLGASTKKSNLAGVIVRMGRYQVGSDKFEHFLSRGFYYFQRHYLKEQPIQESLEYGMRVEKGYLGAAMTGIFSYGDLAANFTGMRFWNNILGHDDDILGPQYNKAPYVKCQNKRWMQINLVDWSWYIDAAWDEGINCSKFKNRKVRDKVLQQIKRLSTRAGKSFSCPVNAKALAEIRKKYGVYADWLINAKGHAALK